MYFYFQRERERYLLVDWWIYSCWRWRHTNISRTSCYGHTKMTFQITTVSFAGAEINFEWLKFNKHKRCSWAPPRLEHHRNSWKLVYRELFCFFLFLLPCMFFDRNARTGHIRKWNNGKQNSSFIFRCFAHNPCGGTATTAKTPVIRSQQFSLHIPWRTFVNTIYLFYFTRPSVANCTSALLTRSQLLHFAFVIIFRFLSFWIFPASCEFQLSR